MQLSRSYSKDESRFRLSKHLCKVYSCIALVDQGVFHTESLSAYVKFPVCDNFW